MSGRPPRRVGALEPMQFGIAFQIAVDAGEGRGSADADAAESSPWRRAALALERHFGDDEETCHSAFVRFVALMDLYTRGALGPWVRSSGRGEGGTDIHPAVLDVASRMRLARNGRLPREKFLGEVESIARERYADLAQWPLPPE